MKSRTSFFNGTVLRKDITRYAPVWGLYTIGLLLFLLLPNIGSRGTSAASDLCYTLSSMNAVNAILGCICALMVFGDLFKTRLCYATHAMPLRREGWFLTHFTAGFLFSFVPNLFVSLLLLPVLKNGWYAAFIWLAVSTLQYLFFFGVGAFCAMCAGNRLGAVAAYLIMIFGLWLVEWYADYIYTPLLYGVEYRWTLPELLMPAAYLSNLDFIVWTSTDNTFLIREFLPGDWLYLGIVAALGVLLAVFAVLIYRKRQLETAGDFLSLPAAKPVFLLVYTFAVAYFISQLISATLIGLFVGLIIGFFTGKMLLERTVKVFKGWNFLRCGILLTLLALSLGLTRLDVGGLTRYVPDTKDISAMHFYGGSDTYYYQTQAQSGWTITDPDEINTFRQLHNGLTDGDYRGSSENTATVYFHYELKNGRTVLRRYEIPVDAPESAFVQQQFSRWEAVFHIGDWEAFVSSVKQLELEVCIGEEFYQHTITTPDQIQGLLDAIKADCDAGHMIQDWNYQQDTATIAWLYIYDENFYNYSESVLGENTDYAMMPVYSVSLNIWENCQYTLAYLENLNPSLEPYNK